MESSVDYIPSLTPHKLVLATAGGSLSGQLLLGQVWAEHATGVEAYTTVAKPTSGSFSVFTVFDPEEFAVNDDVYLSMISGSPVGSSNWGERRTITAINNTTGEITFGNTNGGLGSHDYPVGSPLVKYKGYYEFPEYPQVNSIQFTYIDNDKILALGDRTLRAFSSLGDPGRQNFVQLSATFAYIPNSMYRALERLLDWQRRGHLLTLHPYLVGVPPVLIGNLIIGSRSKNLAADLDKTNVTLTFISAIP